MKHLNIALMLMMSFSVPGYQLAGRIPAAEIRKAPVEDLIRQALEARERGDFEGALTILREAERQDSANLEVSFYIGLTLYNLGRFDASESQLREVLRNSPRYVDAKVILGRVLIALGNLPESERLLREAIAQAPLYVDAYDGLASNLLAQKKNSEAIAVLDEGLGKKPEDPTLLSKKAKIYFISKDYKKAEEVARILTGITDLYGRYQGHVILGKIAFERNPLDISAATPELQEAIDLEPVESEAYIVLTDIYVSMWKFNKAREVLDQALDNVKDRTKIESKIAQVGQIEKDTLNFSVSAAYSQWNFQDGRSPWREFYLDAAWRIDPYKTLVFGFERFSRGGLNDETIHVEYVEKVNKWIYVYASAKYTLDPDFREKNGFKLGSNFVTNPLGLGSTVLVAEAETRNYETGRVYFLTGGVDQYIGDSVIINARVFHVITPSEDFNVWSVKTTWSLTPRISVNANYGTQAEDVNGRLARGTSMGGGVEYRINDRVSVTGNYQRVNTDTYRANQVTAGVKVKFGTRARRAQK